MIAATDAPNEIAAIALIGPFVRPTPRKWWENAAFAAMLAPPWGKGIWVRYYRKNLYPGPKPADHDSYVTALSDNLGEKGRMSSLRGLASNRHQESGRRIERVSQPVLVVMGTADPDFPDAEAEANDLGKLMGAEVLLVDGSGHYPQAENPGEVAPAIIDLVRRATASDED